jgi:CRP-like cAMP-binding protein
MIDALIQRMENFSHLDPLSRNELRAACIAHAQYFSPRQVIFSAGEQALGAYFVLSGFACRNLHLPNGKRPITELLLPGDVFGTRAFLLKPNDHAVSSLTDLQAAFLSRTTLSRWSRRSPSLNEALWRARALQSAIHGQWLINVGSRTAIERLAHLFCELLVRLRAVSLATQDACSLPLTQTNLADATGLTPVHVNRTLARLSRLGISTFKDNRLIVHDPARLQEIGGFDPEYLRTPGPDPQGCLPGSIASPQFDDRAAALVRRPGMSNDMPPAATVRGT